MSTCKGNLKLVHIDDFCVRCGFFNGETIVNGGYGCDHPESGDKELVRLGNFDWGCDAHIGNELYNRHYYIAKKLAGRKITSKRIAKKYIKKARLIEYDNTQLKNIGIRWQGICAASLCPLGSSAEAEDFEEFGEDPNCMSEGQWIIVETKQTQS